LNLNLTDRIKNLIPMLKGPVRLPPDVVRSLRPVRSPFLKWRREGPDNLTVIYSARPKDQFWIGWLARLALQPEERRTELDEISSRVWDLCDGVNKVSDICKVLVQEYKLGDRQVEVSVLQFLNTLRSKRFVGLTEEDKSKVDTAVAKVKRQPETTASDGLTSNGKQSASAIRKRAKQQRRH